MLGLSHNLGIAKKKPATAAVASFDNTYSVAYDGTDDIITTSTTVDFDVFSMSVWLKTTATAFKNIFNKSNDNHMYYAMSGGTIYIKHAIVSASAWNGTSGTTFNDGNWHHIVITAAGGSGVSSEVKWYLDGDLEGTTTGTRTYTNSTDKVIGIGHWNEVTSSAWNGSLDELSVWDNHILTAAEVTAIYNIGEPIDLQSDSGNYVSSANLTHWWRMGDGDTYPTITDNEGSINGTMTNMTSGDIVEDVPS